MSEDTLFKACTGMLGALMSLRSLSASYFRSLETLNLQNGKGEGQGSRVKGQYENQHECNYGK